MVSSSRAAAVLRALRRRSGLLAGALLLLLATGPLAPVGALTRADYDHGAQVFNVRAYGAVGDGVADDTAAIIAADHAAWTAGTLKGGVVYFPPGTYNFSESLTANTSWIGSGIGTTTLKLTFGVGGHIAAINVIGRFAALGSIDYNSVSIRDLSLIGPGRPMLNARNARADGIRLNGQQRIDRVHIERFDSGIVLGQAGGHRTISDVTSTNNYYGLYGDIDNGDNYVVDSNFDGNMFAAVASAARTPFIGLRIQRTKLGHSPYGFFQEPLAGGDAVVAGDRTDTFWLSHVQLQDATFEHIGNGAFWSANYTIPNQARVSRLSIANPRFSWDPAYRIPGRQRFYAMVFGRVTEDLQITDDAGPFLDGDQGTMLVQNLVGSIEWIRSAGQPPKVTVVGGKPTNLNIRSTNIADRRGTATIAAGQTSAEVTLPYLAPASTIFPLVQAMGTGGVPGGVSLYVSVSDVGTPVPTSTKITVNVVGGTPTVALPFSWRLM